MRDDVRGAVSEFRGQAQGDRPATIELHVNRVDIRAALVETVAPMDRGRGRWSVCGQTLTVTRVAME